MFCSLLLAQATDYLTFELSAVFQSILALKLALKDPAQMVRLISKLWYVYQKTGIHFCISIVTSVLGLKTEFLTLN